MITFIESDYIKITNVEMINKLVFLKENNLDRFQEVY